MRFLSLLLAVTACGGVVIDPGHRGLVFDSHTGLQREVLAPGHHGLGAGQRVDDFDVTYSRRSVTVKAVSSEELPVAVDVSVVYRPIVSELYELDTEMGPTYYAKVIDPALRAVVLACLARHTFLDLTRLGTTLADETESDLRQRLAGRHIEIADVSFTSVVLPKEIADAISHKLATPH
ncbi:MAG TPA: SPFH domain-containing protein [Polyangiaceae bacterium]|jgi:regulator of protease activity HflC (stomatin/prohibitin superfamily)